jgi:hypothetical protein
MNLLAIPHGGWFDSLPNPWRLVVRQGFILSFPQLSCLCDQLIQGEDDENQSQDTHNQLYSRHLNILIESTNF